MEEKVKVILPEEEIKEVDFCGTKVKIQTSITLEQASLISKDVKALVFDNEDLDYKMYFSKIRAIKDILELCTNIDTSDFTLDQLKSSLVEELLCVNIDNLYDVIDDIQKQYEFYNIKNCFGILAKKVPTGKQMEKSMEKIKESINGLDSDKLELVAKSIVWNEKPSLGNQLSPAEHKTEE